MPINTRAERMAAVRSFQPFQGPPAPDASITQIDRAAVQDMYFSPDLNPATANPFWRGIYGYRNRRVVSTFGRF
jgi:hypothetical protein